MSEKKIALVTGGTRGIGKGIVERLGADGYTVCFSYVSSDEKAKKLVEELKEKGIVVSTVKDLFSEKYVELLEKLIEIKTNQSLLFFRISKLCVLIKRN